MLTTILLLSVLLLGEAQAQLQNKDSETSIVSQEEFESLKEQFNSLEKELNYWQNVTISILKKYLIDNEESEISQCTDNDHTLTDQLEGLDQRIEGISNNTKGLEQRLFSIESDLDSIKEDINEISHPSLGSFLNPASSCKLIPQDSQSGHYWIQHTGTGYANLEYCDMNRTCCNSTGGWMRVAHLNFTDTNQSCPSGFRLISSPKRTCGTPGISCASTTFPLNGVKYSRVCGKIIAYQYGKPNAFHPYDRDHSITIDGQFVDGVSLTHGKRPRKHIWTFAAARSETVFNHNACPCTKTNTVYTGVVPPFIGQDYFCETGSSYEAEFEKFYHADPLWDGSGCGSTSSCCDFNNPPWFCQQLPQPTSDDIEMRVCTDHPITNEDVALETVEVYVQ